MNVTYRMRWVSTHALCPKDCVRPYDLNGARVLISNCQDCSKVEVLRAGATADFILIIIYQQLC